MTVRQQVLDALATDGITGPLAKEIADLWVHAFSPDADLTALIEERKTFYSGSRGRERITEMVSGHLHNAAAKLKRTPHGGMLAFTILAMDAEIQKRDDARKQEEAKQNGG